MASKAVDVIVPVHNQFSVVKTCIESVLESAQFNSFNLVVIDDASTEPLLRNYLADLENKRAISLITNRSNLGFTKTVNLGMGLNTDRDVLLLNSDTVVYGSWLERLREAAYSDKRVATVNPMTNASHISNYPFRDGNDGVVLEVSDDVLDDIASRINARRYVTVHTTVGFCMFIKRACINTIGLFDVLNFPLGYGEESDFCYRAKKLGWRHLVTGDVFVRHVESQSFGERKIMLMKNMLQTFLSLHPDCPQLDEAFRRNDPLSALRARLDLARARLLLKSNASIRMHIVQKSEENLETDQPCALIYCEEMHDIRLSTKTRLFPNLERYRLPGEMLQFNSAMTSLGIETIRFSSLSDLSVFEQRIAGTAMEVVPTPKLAVETMRPAMAGFR
jgi:GT2 family glycosyltransferase